jgi:lipoprotein NlpI
MRAGLACFIVLLAGCEKTQWTRDEVMDIAGDAAPDHESEISELRQRIEDIEAKVGSQERVVRLGIERANLSDEAFSLNNREIKRLSDNDRAFQAQIDFLRARQGLPPMPSE